MLDQIGLHSLSEIEQVNENGKDVSKTSEYLNHLKSEKSESELSVPIHPELVNVHTFEPKTKVETNEENSELQKLVNHIKNIREEKSEKETSDEKSGPKILCPGHPLCESDEQFDPRKLCPGHPLCPDNESGYPGNSPFPNLRAVPPEYLQVSGWKDCLGTKYHSSHSVVCLPFPSGKPKKCLQSSWDELTRIWESTDEIEICDESAEKRSKFGNWPLNFGSDEHEPRGLPPSSGKIRQNYLEIDGWRHCLRTYTDVLDRSVVEEYCLPMKKHSNCKENSWEQMKREFTGEKCPERNYIGKKHAVKK